jgi:hypothetical protein
LLSQEDLEKVVFEGSMNDMLYWSYCVFINFMQLSSRDSAILMICLGIWPQNIKMFCNRSTWLNYAFIKFMVVIFCMHVLFELHYLIHFSF